MIVVYGYVAAWGLPDISPYVTKLVNWLVINKIQYEYKNQDLSQLDVESPFGKLPYIIDTDDGTKVGDSNLIIEYLTSKYKVAIDKDLSPVERAVSIAFDRLIGEHLYYSGVLQPRWREDEGFETYIPYIVQGAQVTPPLRQMLDAFRVRVLDGFNGQGMGRRDVNFVLAFYKQDIDALSEYLSDKKYLMGAKVHTVDASLYSILRHLSDQPQKWKGTGYLESKENLVAYMQRMRDEFQV